MLKINNPYSRKRRSKKEKIDQKITNLIVPYIKMVPLDESGRAKSKYLPKVLEMARMSVKGWERDKISSSEIPHGIDIDLISLYVPEYIPIEDVDKLNRGLKKLVKNYPYKFQHGQAERIDGFCNNVKKSIHGGRWSNFGFIDFTKEANVSDFVKNIHIQGTHLTSSSIILQFVITPSDKFIIQYKKIMEMDIKEGHSFDFKFKQLLKFWGGKGLSEDIVKNQKLEDLIIELKWRTMKEIRKYFPMYFTNNNLIPPSIEIYKLSQSACVFNELENEKRSSFWHSIGMDNTFSDISKDGYWQFFSESKEPYLIDNSIKVTCNSLIKREPMYHSLDFQITVMTEEFADIFLPIMVMRQYAMDTSEKIAIQQNVTFSSIKKNKPNYQNLIDIRYDLEKALQILKRFKNEIGENYFNKAKSQLKKIAEFEPANTRFINKSGTERIVDQTEYIIDKTYEHSQHCAKMIDDTVQLLEIKTNNSLRRRSFGLSVITVVLSLAATIFAGLSLFYQLSDENQKKIMHIFNPFIEIWKFFFF